MFGQDVEAALHDAGKVDFFHRHVAHPLQERIQFEFQFVHVGVELLSAQ